MRKYRIHFTDDYGNGSFEVDTYEEMQEAVKNLNEDTEHCAWDIWVESFNEEDGYWEA